MPKIIPIKELKDTNRISEMCANTNQPIFVTKNGYGELVIMSIKTYEERMARLEQYEKMYSVYTQGKKDSDVTGEKNSNEQ